jgi:hypothetical protein
MPDGQAKKENLITQCQVYALRQQLNLNESQAFPSIMPVLDPGYEGQLQIQVVPGAVSTEGKGKGAQEGGALIRMQSFKHVVFYRLKMDQHGRSDQILTENANGILDLFERMRRIFESTFLALGPQRTNLLIEPMWYAGESETIWNDPELGIVQRSITWNCVFERDLPNEVTLAINTL